jgi:hypothetical protein
LVIKTNFGAKQASEFNLGLVRFATPDEAILGIHTNKAVTPKGLNEAINSINGLIYDIVLLADNWEGATAPYTYTINSITGITSNTNAHTMLNSNVTEAQLLSFREAMIVDGGLSTDTIVFKALGIKPAINIPIKLIVSKSLYIEDDYEPQYEVDTLPRATVDIYGTVRIATPFDVEDATSNIRVITPLLLAKNMPNGVAGLDASSLINDSYISNNIARVNSPALTGIPTAPTAVAGTNSNQIATTAYVKTEINSVLAAADALVFKGTLGTGGTITTLPTSDYKIGWTYKVITAGTYAGHVCEIGDMITCIVDFDTVSNDSDWVVIPNNSDGVVIGPTSAINNHIPIFNGTTGKLIKDSGFTIVAGTNSNQIATTAYADALVAESITDGVTGIAPSQNVVFDALALKADITYVNTSIHEILNNISIVNNYKSFTATPSQTNFDISDIYQHSNIIVFRNGLFQLVNVDYTLDDTIGAETVVLTNPCSGGETVVVYFNTLELTI